MKNNLNTTHLKLFHSKWVKKGNRKNFTITSAYTGATKYKLDWLKLGLSRFTCLVSKGESFPLDFGTKLVWQWLFHLAKRPLRFAIFKNVLLPLFAIASWNHRRHPRTHYKCFSCHYCLTLFFLTLIVSSLLFSNAFGLLQDLQSHWLKPIYRLIWYNIPLILLLSILAPSSHRMGLQWSLPNLPTLMVVLR